ncbi:unnamed protein product, partial [Adineta steineri]
MPEPSPPEHVYG